MFVDFWNFQLSLRSAEPSFMTDWRPIGPVLASAAGRLVDPTQPFSFEGMNVYGSFDPAKPQDANLKRWFTTFLDKVPGTRVVLVERQKKRSFPKCPACQLEVSKCLSCGADMRGTEEKGVDTRIVADMISLAWADAYDIAVLVSADRDFIPVAEFLETKGIKVIHGAFPPNGSFLSQKCWGHLNLIQMMDMFRRTGP